MAPSVRSRKFSMRHFRSRKTFETRNKKKVRKPTLKPSKQSKCKESDQKLKEAKADTNKASESKLVTNEQPSASESKPLTIEKPSVSGSKHATIDYPSVFGENFTFGNGVDCIAETTIESIVISFEILKEILLQVPMYEEDFKIMASLGLLFYGGSWTNLAGSIAAIEAFGTIPALQEVFEVGMAFLFDDSEDGVTPARIKANLRQLGLQTTLLIAVLVSPSWAEICITIAFASKFTILVPVEELLKKMMSRPDFAVTEFHDYFDDIDTSWFDLIAVIACNILSLIFFGCLPRLTTAMYMGYLGVSLLMDSLVARPIMMIMCESEIFDKDLWMEKSTQYSVWAAVAFMAIWQAVSGYDGVFLFLSWSMFLYPVVAVFNCLRTHPLLMPTKVE